jgi:hypothetical protein
VKEYVDRFPTTRSCTDLIDLIGRYPSPEAFCREALRYNHDQVGQRILDVARYLVDAQGRFPEPTEAERLTAWAQWTRPGDYLELEINGFKLAGFQYLRMLFGAETTKPDVHIIGYVSKAIGRKVSDVHALYILERAAEISGRSIRALDNVIWELGARG